MIESLTPVSIIAIRGAAAGAAGRREATGWRE